MRRSRDLRAESGADMREWYQIWRSGGILRLRHAAAQRSEERAQRSRRILLKWETVRILKWMPAPQRAWWHSQFSTYCAWLPGDKRGFRSGGHRIHSSGHYKKPPLAEEHAGLREYHQQRHPEPLEI